MVRNPYRFDIEYNNTLGQIMGVAVTTRPNIPVPKQRAEYVEVPGRQGTLRVSDGTFEDVVLEVQMNFVRAPKWWHETARDVRNWIFGSGILRLGNLTGWHYRVKVATCSDIENINKMGGQFTAQFICEPFQYKDGGDEFHRPEEVTLNPYYECEPCYRIEGNGQCTLTVNGNQFTANVNGVIYIDTERRLVYNEAKENKRTQTQGEYQDLFLPHGQNRVGVSSGFTLRVKPNWRSI